MQNNKMELATESGSFVILNSGTEPGGLECNYSNLKPDAKL